MTLPRSLFAPAHDRWRAHVARFLDECVAPNYATWEAEGGAPRRAWDQAGAAGLFTASIPHAFSGETPDFIRSVVVIEELAKRRFGGFMTYLHSDIVVPYIVRFGTDAQKEKYLLRCASGRTLTAVAMTEPHSGSDIESMKTVLENDGDGYRLRGTKTHVSCGMQADVVLVAAKGSRGMSIVFVDVPANKLSRTPIEKTGLRALDTATLVFDDCRVGRSDILGAEGLGFVYLMKMLCVERLVLAVSAQASCVQTLREIVAACSARRTRTGSVLDFQNTQFALADALSECEANQAFVDRAIALHLEGKLELHAACMGKLRTTELLKRLSLLSIQLRGAEGLTSNAGLRLSQDVLDACVQTIWGGTSEVMKHVIAQGLSKWV